jgi:hypothetical protein
VDQLTLTFLFGSNQAGRAVKNPLLPRPSDRALGLSLLKWSKTLEANFDGEKNQNRRWR